MKSAFRKSLIKTAVILLLSGAPAFAANSGIVPDYFKNQFAGNIGFISAGLGYGVLNERLQFDFLYGYVPESAGGTEIHTFTTKANLLPIKIRLSNKYELYPLTLSGFMSYTPGDQYETKWPDKYPEGYYKPTAFYSGIAAGLRFRIKSTGGFLKNDTDLYTEVGTLSQYFKEYRNSNGYLKLSDIVNVAFGAVVYF
jgi:hypothetical protein